MTLLGSVAHVLVDEIEPQPDRKEMLNYVGSGLELNRAESGDYDGSIDLFRDRFFSREEGGTNVRQVWVEVRLLQATGLASAGKCEEGLRIADTLGAPVTGLSFTSDGLSPFLDTPRTRYLLGGLYASCAEPEKAAAKLLQAAGGRGVV